MKHLLLPIYLWGLSGLLQAQSLTPTVVGSVGGTGSAGGTTLHWTLGEAAVLTLGAGGYQLTQGFNQADPIRLRLRLSVVLEGPYNSATGLMLDALRAQATFPLNEPYTSLGYAHVGGGGETIASAILAQSGPDAIVDWVLVELRAANDPANVVYSRSALLQRDGDVVDTDGASAVALYAPAGQYHVAALHRNHLGVMSGAALALLAGDNTLDLSLAGTVIHGNQPRKSITGAFPAEVLWAGDVSFDGQLKYTGSANDRDPVLQRIGGIVPTNFVPGYWPEDCTLDGVVKYTGSGNDRDLMLQNIGGIVPTAIRNAQLP